MSQEANQETLTRSPRLWLGLFAGWLMQLVFKNLLSLIVVGGMGADTVAGRVHDSQDTLWYALQLFIVIACCSAGSLAAIVARGRYRALAIGLMVLSLMNTFFEQLPRSGSIVALLVWALGPCLGVVIGVWLVRFFIQGRRQA